MGSRHSYLRILVLAWLALASLPAWSQQYSLQTYDRKAGLESLSINAMLQDRRGFVWAGTEMGLYRFDGSRFERMGVAQGFDQGEYVTAVEQNPRLGRIWVATQSGLRMGDGLHFTKIEPDGRPLVADIGRPMVALDDGRLILVRNDQLIVLSGGGGGQPWLVRPMFDAAQLDAHPQLRKITALYASQGRLWLGCDTAVCEVDPVGAIVVHGPKQGVPVDSWSGMLMDRGGTLWLRGVRHVRALPAGASTFVGRDVPLDDMDVVKDDGSFVEDPEGRIITSTNRGLARWDGKAWTALDSRNGLPEIGVTTLLFDTQGTLWLGTYGRGIARWNGYGRVEGWGLEQGFDSVPSWSILRLDPKHLWFGNELGGSVFTAGETRMRPWPVRIAPAPRQVLSLARAPDGAMWIGLYDQRVLRYDPASQRTTLAAQLPTFVKKLLFDRDGRLWIATVDGIYRIDHAGAPAQRIPVELTTAEQCSDIAEDGHGTLWFACNEGMLRHAAGQWTRMQPKQRALASGFSAVAVATDGSLWLGANEPGVFHATVHGDQLVVADVPDTWLDNTLAYFVRRDHRGWIWIGGGGGVDIFDGRYWTHLSQDNGLLWDETDQNSFFEDTDGSVWIGSAIGVSHVLQPEAMVERRPRKVIITSVMHGTAAVKDGDSVRIDGGRAPLVLRYAVLGSSSGSAPRFRYRLQGSEWVQTASHIISLTGLSSGDHRLEIQAIDDDHRTISESAHFDFRIPPPWWLSWWTSLIGLGLLAIVVAWSWRWHSRRLLRQNRRLETMVAGRTAELTEEKRELEQARAELYHQATHDSLTGLYNRKAILDLLQAQLDPVARIAPGLAVGLIDADHFKRINDTFGHQAGDAALQAIARHLQSHVRDGDWLGRYGGEEILMLLPGISRADAEQRMRSLQAAVSDVPHEWNGQRFAVTLSIGMVWVGRESTSVEELVRRADEALYQAKSKGRDRVVAELLGAGAIKPEG